MDILKEVRSITRPWHDKMEEVALSEKIAAATLSLTEYKAVILGHYIFHREAEHRLMQHEMLSSTEGLELEVRMKTSLLELDMHQLDLESFLFDFRTDISIDTVPQALGCMYVMEGATLGGKVIGRALQKVPEISGSNDMHYYGCYGEQTGQRWKKFKEVVEQQVVTEVQEEEFVVAASATFRAYADCMQQAFQELQGEAAS